MTQPQRASAFIGIAILMLAAGLTGCATSSPAFRSSFLPSASASASADSSESENGNEPNLVPPPPVAVMARETPDPLPASVTAAPDLRPSETEQRLMRAQERFEAGRRAYDQGETELARREFDRAIEILLRTPEAAPDRARIERRLEQIVDSVFRFDVNGLGSGEDWDKVVYDKSPLDGMLEMTFPVDPRLKSKVVEEIRATVSQLPLEESDEVLSYIHFFSSERGRKILVSGLKRSGKYRPLIQKILDEEGVPQELIYLAQAESGFQPRALSHRQAAGMWQFVQWRGREYGLNQNGVFDERLDPEKATRAAARHLRDLYNQFGDWYLAMAAYNCGPGCVDRAVQRTGYADFWKLRDLGALPRETTNYVPLIVAMTIMVKNASDYGLDNIEIEAPLEYETLKVDAPTNLALLADAAERSVSEVRELNPSLLRSVAPAGYELRLPKGSLDSVRAALDAIPHDRRDTWRMHRVGPGETLSTIAKRYRTAPNSIAEANRRTLEGPLVGDVLIIPASYSEDTVKASGKRRVAKQQKVRSARSSRNVSSASSLRSASSKNKASARSAGKRVASSRLKSASLRRIANN